MKKIVILAAGKGTRMQSELPKVLVDLNGRPMIHYLLDAVIASGVDARPIVVVSLHNQDIIKEYLRGYDIIYTVQEQQLGTGHAFASIRPILDPSVDTILNFYGDHPFVSAESIRQIAAGHKGKLSMVTTKLDDFQDWRHNLYHWGRIIRSGGQISQIIEFKDASDEVKEMKEVNPGFFVFDRHWVFDNIDRLRDDNSQHEYYLTDMVKIAFDEGEKINDLKIKVEEVIGINSQEELEIAKQVLIARGD